MKQVPLFSTNSERNCYLFLTCRQGKWPNNGLSSSAKIRSGQKKKSEFIVVSLTKFWKSPMKEPNEQISTYRLYCVSTAAPAHYRYTWVFLIWMNLQAYFVSCRTKSCQHLFNALRIRIPETKKTVLLIHSFLHWQHSTPDYKHSSHKGTTGVLKFKWQLQYPSLDLVFCNLFFFVTDPQLVFDYVLGTNLIFSVKNI